MWRCPLETPPLRNPLTKKSPPIFFHSGGAADRMRTKCEDQRDAKQLMPDSGLLEAFLDLRPALHRYLLLRGARADEAEDVLQDVGGKLSAEGIDAVQQPRAYLYRVVSNHFLHHRRAADRRQHREAAWVDTHTGEPREIDQQPSAEAHLIAREQLSILQRVLDELPERTRAIFRRFRIDQQSQRQIAQEHGISVSAVEKHLARAYEAVAGMKRRLDGESTPPRYLKDTQKRRDI